MKIDSEKSEQIAPAAQEHISLDLSRHCIQTATRRCYEKTLSECLRAKGESGVLERRVDLLRQALETLDFGLLRSRWPELAGGGTAVVALSRQEGRILVHLDAQSFPAPLRKRTGTMTGK
ncbi:MAG TPA: hypothetical protein ENF48_04695 [Desulfobacteraceae bacterium]|nr:hypothetical protein [Deltaproteobacteria bacterium]RLB95038.1 MAG: hypothetical protein DRH76_08620 [Deltaproteobacteria bacterium]HDI59646.1 hypothetical protein [Desulfobacteraceae bacterium]